MGDKTLLVILTRNELACLKVIFPKIPKPSPQAGFDDWVAIDGCSTDGTIEFFKEQGVPVISQSKRGRGEAFQLALSQVPADYYIFFSPDGNEAIEDLPRFKPLLKGGADLVIASRMCEGALNEEDHQIVKLRKWANNAFNLMANLFFRKKGKYITDSINGFRALSKATAEKLQLDAFDYTIEYQMTMRALRAGLNVVEFPTQEGQRVAGETGAPSWSTGLRFIKCFFRELFRPRQLGKAS